MSNELKRPELLSPAGSPDKMKAAILYGADAVYLAGDDFGMRAAASNFSLDELKDAVEYAHAGSGSISPSTPCRTRTNTRSLKNSSAR